MFLGANALTLDAKGRMAIPAKYRDALSPAGQTRLVLTINPRDACLWLYPEAIWTPIAEQIAALPPLKPENRALQRLLLGSACALEIDAQGRIAVSNELRAHAGLTKKMMLIGLGRKFELWDSAAWAEVNTKNLAAAQQADSEISAELSELKL
jgi:MraZ protein